MKRVNAITIFLLLLLLLNFFLGGAYLSTACVGRTIYIGYYKGEAEQRIISSILSIFVDERTGTSVKLVELGGREQGFDYLRRNKVSIMVEYTGKVLEYYGETKGIDSTAIDFDSQKSTIGTELKAIFVTSPGFDGSVSQRAGDRNLGKAYIVLSKRALSIFPAMPRLLKKLGGKIDNEAMAHFIENYGGGSPDKGTRSFLKKNKLI